MLVETRVSRTSGAKIDAVGAEQWHLTIQFWSS
jgi:hypothetical protein